MMHGQKIVKPVICYQPDRMDRAIMPAIGIGLHISYDYLVCLYRVIHKSVKHFKNSQQIDYATDHGNSYVDRERNCFKFFLRKSPRTLLP